MILAFLVAAPAASAACGDQVLERPFMPWGDPAYYTLVPDGDLTGDAAGWDLDGAELVADNEPWYVHGGDTPAALHLSRGDSATTPPVCVTLAHPTIRFFARGTGGILGSLEVEVVLSNGLTLPVGAVLGLLHGDDWAPAAPQLVVGNLLDGEVRFRFRATGRGSAWMIDDVYVDPYKKG